MTGGDVIDAYRHFLAAAERLGVAEHARNDVLTMARNAGQSGATFSSLLLRQCSAPAQSPQIQRFRT